MDEQNAKYQKGAFKQGRMCYGTNLRPLQGYGTLSHIGCMGN